MSAKRLAVLLAPILFFAIRAHAQNELSFTGGRTFVSTQTILNAPAGGDPTIHFGNEESVAFDYAHLFRTHRIFGIYGELPAAIYFRMDVHTQDGVTPKDVGALFLTPSVRVNIFAGESVTPWVSAGAGYGRFREAPELGFSQPNPGPTGTNTFAAQYGAGLDAWFWSRWGARFEARDFYSGVPSLDVVTGRTRQHNYYVGAGIVHRF